MLFQLLAVALLVAGPSASERPAGSQLPQTAVTALQICRKSEDGLPARMRSVACDLVLSAPSAGPTERMAAHLGKALALRELGQPAQSLQELDRALEISPEDGSVQLARAEVLSDMGNGDGALEAYAQAVRIDPDDPRPRQGRVDMLMDRGRYAEAIADFDVLLRQAEDPGVYYNGRGVARLRLLDREKPFTDSPAFKQILSDFDRAVETMHGTDRAAAFFNRAELRLEQHQWEAARQDYDQALALRPDRVRYLLGRARAQRGAGELAGARTDYDRIAVLPNADPWTEDARSERRAIALPGEADSFLRATDLTVLSAEAYVDRESGRHYLKVRLDEESRKQFAALTTDNVGAMVDFLVDDQLITSAAVREPITLGNLQMLGDEPIDDIRRLARRLMQPDAKIVARLAPDQAPP